MTPTTLSIAIPADVHNFCAPRKLLGDLDISIRLAEEAFAPFERWQLSLQEDPDVENETYVILDVWIATEDIHDVLRRNDRYVHNWVASNASPEGKHRIRVLFNFC